MCLLLLSVHAALTITDYRQKYCTAWTDRRLHSGLTNGLFVFNNRKEQVAADVAARGPRPARAPLPRTPRPCVSRTRSVQILPRPGRYSEMGQETLIDRVIYNCGLQ